MVFSLMLLAGGWQTGAWWGQTSTQMAYLHGTFNPSRFVAERQYGLPAAKLWEWQVAQAALQARRVHIEFPDYSEFVEEFAPEPFV